jgi:TonB-dependent starch-binding outer membrane protein SusC
MHMQLFLRMSLLLVTCGLIGTTAVGQDRTISGIVTSGEDGTPLSGTSVSIMGTSMGAAADMDGRYSLNVPSGTHTLRFSFLGFIAREVEVTGSSDRELNVVLQPDARQLDEVVVVGYGQQLQRTLTGNISRVSAREIEGEVGQSIEQAIQGRMAGVDIQAGTGKLGQGIQVRVRGASSVSASNQPLYVIDGIPVTTQNLSGNAAATNPMADINPSDIESIEILKDASAAAIYGARGSNGVVLITTRSGATGRTRVNASYQRSYSAPTRLVEFMSGPEYVEFMREAAANSARITGNPGYVTYAENLLGAFGASGWQNDDVNFDWQREAFQSAGGHKFEMSAQGGDARTRFFISGSLDDADGILIRDHFQRLSGRVNLEHDVSDRFQVGGRLNMVRTFNTRLSPDHLFSTPMQIVAQMPINPIYTSATGADGYVASEDLNHSTLYFNSLLFKDNTHFHTTVFRSLGNVHAAFELMPRVTLRSEFGFDVLDQNEDQHYNSQVARAMTDAQEGLGVNNWDRVVNWTTNHFVNYQERLGQAHRVDATAGVSYQAANWGWSQLTASGFPNDDFTSIQSAAQIRFGSAGETEHKFVSSFARLNYDFHERYLLTLSGRYDGSSRFGDNHRFGFFPAVSAGWIVSDEAFMQAAPVSFLKLRASYGLTGNAEIQSATGNPLNFASRALWSGIGYGGLAGMEPTQTLNPDLRWERTAQFNTGVDFSVFNDRVSAQVDYYLKHTRDLLLNVQVPATSGFTTETRNVGRLRNEGVEFVLNTRNMTGAFGWTSTFTFGANRNRITDLDGQVITGGFINRAVEGQPIGVFFALEYAGVDPENGDALYYINPENGQTYADGTTIGDRDTTADPWMANRVVIGSPHPDFTGGLNNQFTFRGFSLSALLQFSYGNQIYDGGGIYKTANGDFFDNQHRNQLRRWREPGDVTDVPEARLLLGNGTEESSRYLYDGSYLRLKNVTLGYQLPFDYTQRLGVQAARIYVSGQNLLTFTRYPWWDPEVNADAWASNISLGNEFYSAPQARTVTTGIQLTF